MLDKAHIRKAAAERRSQVPNREQLSERIWTSVFSTPEYRAAHRIFAYAGHGSEVQTLAALELILRSGRPVALPFCEGSTLQFYDIASTTGLEAGAFGIQAPSLAVRSQTAPVIPAAGDLVIVPGLAFSPSGHRVGYGAGFYDRFLAGADPHAVKVGLAFSVQLVPVLPVEPFDVSMNLIVTENDVLRLSSLVPPS